MFSVQDFVQDFFGTDSWKAILEKDWDFFSYLSEIQRHWLDTTDSIETIGELIVALEGGIDAEVERAETSFETYLEEICNLYRLA